MTDRAVTPATPVAPVVPFAGVVLAGGRSRRMGRTKALVPIDGLAMAEHVIAALRRAGCDPVLVYGGDVEELAALSAPVVPDRYVDEGPVGGVLGALGLLEQTAAPGALVVPCDVPDLDARALDPLFGAARQAAGDIDLVVARTDRIEPMCAIWMPGARQTVEELFVEGERALHGVVAALSDAGAVIEVAVPAAPLRNVNTPEDVIDPVDVHNPVDVDDVHDGRRQPHDDQ